MLNAHLYETAQSATCAKVCGMVTRSVGNILTAVPVTSGLWAEETGAGPG